MELHKACGAPRSASAAVAPPVQHTLARPVRIEGKGLLLGEDAEIEIHLFG